MTSSESRHHATSIAHALLMALAATGALCAAQPASADTPLTAGTGLRLSPAAWWGSPTDTAESARLAMAENRHLESRLRLQPEEPTTPPQGSSAEDASPSSSEEELAKKLSNPVASLISIPFQFNLDTGLGPNGTERLTLNIQPVIPFSISEDWNLITRTIVPVIYQGSLAEGLDSEFGMGDIVQSFFFSPKEPVGGWILAAGPVALWPTGTEPLLRTEQFGLGPTVLALRQSKGWTYGMLANHLWGVTGSDDHPDVNATFLQPFVGYTWPSATTLTLNTESTYDWTGQQWTVPVNLILSQVVKVGDQPVQFFFGGRYYAESPLEGQEWGIRFGFTLMFPR
jgi:hypothetical protein